MFNQVFWDADNLCGLANNTFTIRSFFFFYPFFYTIPSSTRSPISTSPSLNSHPFSLALFSISQQSFFAPFLPTHPKIPFHPLFFLLSTFICGHVIPRPASRLFFFYLTRTFTLPFSQHLPHPSLSHPPFPLFFLHPTHHTCSTFHSHIHSLKSKITGWDQIFIHRIRIPGLLHFNTF